MIWKNYWRNIKSSFIPTINTMVGIFNGEKYDRDSSGTGNGLIFMQKSEKIFEGENMTEIRAGPARRSYFCQ